MSRFVSAGEADYVSLEQKLLERQTVEESEGSGPGQQSEPNDDEVQIDVSPKRPEASAAPTRRNSDADEGLPVVAEV